MRQSLSTDFGVLKEKKFIYGAGALAIVAAITAAFLMSGNVQAVVGGPNCNVPADYPTIQAAVNAPGCATIKVAPGNYSESVTIARSVNLKGAKSGQSAHFRSGSGESKVTGVGGAVFTVQAPKVTIDGFSITNPGQGLGIIVKTAGNDADVKNNIVDLIGGASFASNTVGVYLETGPDGVSVSGNRITNIQSGPPTGSAQGILVGDSTSGNPSQNTKIKDNRVTNITSSRGAYGIQVNNGASTVPAANGYAEVKIDRNRIRDLTGEWAHAIGLEGETPNAKVRYNIISNLTDVNPTPIADAAAVFFQANPFFTTVDVNRNSLDVTPAAYGIALHPSLSAAFHPTLEVNGECNWWGASNGPGPVGSGSGSRVSTHVDFNPWLNSSNLDRDCDEEDDDDEDDDDDERGRRDDD